MIQKKEHPFKNHQMPLPMRLYFSAITFTFKILGIASPRLAGKLALQLFMTPPNFGIPRRERKLREDARLTKLNIRDRDISIRSWGNSGNPTVLLSHGWGGRCTQLHAFIQPLVDANYRVVGFDVPGHGDSDGKRSNMLDVASIISEIEKTEGSFEAIIGHSFGTGTTLLSIDKFEVKPRKVILIAYFSDISYIIDIFGILFKLRNSTLESMKKIALKKLATRYGVSWNWEDISPLETIKSVKADLLLIHDEKDHEVPYSQALPLQNVMPNAQVISTSGYGHRKILLNKQVTDSVLGFIKA